MSKASQHAYRAIREAILRNHFKPGQRLVESELADYCGVSRTPIRDALRQLAADMFVRQVPNLGTFVIETSEEDVGDLFEIRAMLEGYAARRAAAVCASGGNEAAEGLASLDDQIARIDRALDNGDPYYLDSFLDANRQIHDIVISMAGSERLRMMLHRLTEQPVILRTIHRYSLEDLKRSNAHHRELAAALRAGDALWAESVMTAHILAAYRSFTRGDF